MAVPAPDQELGFTGHAGVYCTAPEKTAKDAVIGIGGKTADHIAWIDIFNRDIDIFGLEVI